MINLCQIPDHWILRAGDLKPGINVAVKLVGDSSRLHDSIREFLTRYLFNVGANRLLNDPGLITGYDVHEVQSLRTLGFNAIVSHDGFPRFTGDQFVDESGRVGLLNTKPGSAFRAFVERRIFDAIPLPVQTGPLLASKGSPAASVEKMEILPIHRAMAATRRRIGIYDGLVK